MSKCIMVVLKVKAIWMIIVSKSHVNNEQVHAIWNHIRNGCTLTTMLRACRYVDPSVGRPYTVQVLRNDFALASTGSDANGRACASDGRSDWWHSVAEDAFVGETISDTSWGDSELWSDISMENDDDRGVFDGPHVLLYSCCFVRHLFCHRCNRCAVRVILNTIYYLFHPQTACSILTLPIWSSCCLLFHSFCHLLVRCNCYLYWVVELCRNLIHLYHRY